MPRADRVDPDGRVGVSFRVVGGVEGEGVLGVAPFGGEGARELVERGFGGVVGGAVYALGVG